MDDSCLQPNETKRASEALFESLQEQVLQGTYRAGEKLPTERELMKLYGRSHPTVREALKLLESAGYVEVVQGGGITVREISDRETINALCEALTIRKVSMGEVLELFQEIEPPIAALVAVKRKEEDLEQLRRQCLLINQSTCFDEQLYNAIRRCHTCLAAAAHNPMISVIWRSIGRILPANYSIEPSDMELMQIKREHVRLYESIAREDTASAAAHDAQCWILHQELRSGVLGQDQDAVLAESGAKASQEVYDHIRDSVLQGVFQPGERLPAERVIAAMTGRSRPVIREALKMLEAKGFVTIVRGSGAYINGFTTRELERLMADAARRNLISKRDLLEFRRICGPAMVGFAASRRTLQNLAAIREALGRVSESSDDGELISAVFDFKTEVARSCHNELIMILSSMTAIFIQEKIYGLRQPFRQESKPHLAEHCERMYQAIVDSDAERASAAGAEHLAYVDSVLKHYM
ncbi:MAG: FadR family transcriptional regulator [Mogibacterium sp.]|nr:FadR family transcriptional regulator [Mogibacterium sp.]